MLASSVLLTPELARRAVELMRPSIELALSDPAVSGLGVLHLVVMSPRRTTRTTSSADDFEASILHEQSIGPRERWDVDYAAFARNKARLSWLHGEDSRQLVLMRPHLLDSSDAHQAWGSACLDGLVVAASGAQPIWDEAFAVGVAAVLRTLCWVQVHG